jgi:hypothetical protein
MSRLPARQAKIRASPRRRRPTHHPAMPTDPHRQLQPMEATRSKASGRNNRLQSKRVRDCAVHGGS